MQTVCYYLERDSSELSQHKICNSSVNDQLLQKHECVHCLKKNPNSEPKISNNLISCNSCNTKQASSLCIAIIVCFRFRVLKGLISHMQEAHNFKMDEQKLIFGTHNEFLEWKKKNKKKRQTIPVMSNELLHAPGLDFDTLTTTAIGQESISQRVLVKDA